MLHIVDDTNRDRFLDLLIRMFADRKQVFIDTLQWDLAVTANRFEIDPFDGARAVYVIATDDDSNHLGSLRLLCTDRPHILGNLFPHLCDDGVPTGTKVREITRLCISPSVPRRNRRLVRDRLISAMVDYALAMEISALTGVVTAQFLDQILTMGWKCDPLGDRLDLCSSKLGAFCAHIDENTPALLQRTGIYSAAMLATTDQSVPVLTDMVLV
jgi:N-acyl-L-homoserine lactone synthetase